MNVPSIGSRSLIVGKTGSGKTTLEKRLIHAYPKSSIIVLDPKCSSDFDDYVKCEGDLMSLPSMAEKSQIIVYQPPELEVSKDHYNSVLKWVYDRTNTVLVIDELNGLSDNNRTYPNYLNALYTRGRTRGITIIACTQRPRGVPRFCISECEYHFVFELGLADDRKYLSQELGPKVINRPNQYSFWFSRNHSDPQHSKLKL